MSKPWFRFYVKALESPKVQRLTAEQFKVWVNLLCLARMSNGVLPPVADIAFKLRIHEKDAAKGVAALITARLLDQTNEGLVPHDWDEMQYDSDVSTDRVKRFRERKGNVSETAGNGFAKRFDSESVSESESESVSLSCHEGIGSSDSLKGAHRLRQTGAVQ